MLSGVVGMGTEVIEPCSLLLQLLLQLLLLQPSLQSDGSAGSEQLLSSCLPCRQRDGTASAVMRARSCAERRRASSTARRLNAALRRCRCSEAASAAATASRFCRCNGQHARDQTSRCNAKSLHCRSAVAVKQPDELQKLKQIRQPLYNTCMLESFCHPWKRVT